jgi:hypothetical protein
MGEHERGGGVDTPPLDFLFSFEITPPYFMVIGKGFFVKERAKVS